MKKVLFAFLCACLLCAPAWADKTIAGLGTSPIEGPSTSGGGWSYVYYYGHPQNDAATSRLKYRVLANGTTDFGGKTLLLDCDAVWTLHELAHSSNAWSTSEARNYLNTTFLNNLTAQEQAALAESVKTLSGTTALPDSTETLEHTSLTGEKVFLLDVTEATNTAYGYALALESGDVNRVKKNISNGGVVQWWLRSPSSYKSSLPYVGYVKTDGSVGDDHTDNAKLGLSPAFNVKLSSVVFSSLVTSSTSVASSGSEYKLTLLDASMDIAVSNLTRSGSTVTLSYDITGDNAGDATQISVLMTDGTWSASGWSDGAAVKFYKPIEIEEKSGSAAFDLPSDYDASWKTYILAENVGTWPAWTDYASVPAAFTIPTESSTDPSEPTASAPTISAFTLDGVSDGGAMALGTTKTATVTFTGENVKVTAEVSSSDVITLGNVTTSGSTATFTVTPMTTADSVTLTATASNDVGRVQKTLTFSVTATQEEAKEVEENVAKENAAETLSADISAISQDVKTEMQTELGGDLEIYAISSADIQSSDRNISNRDSALQNAVNSGDLSPLCVLPQLKPTKTGIYVFKLTFTAGKSGTLHFFPGTGGTVNGASVSLAAASTAEGTALFYADESYKTPITSVAATADSLFVAAAFEAGTTYTPVVAVESTSGEKEEEEEEQTTPTSNKGSGGCDAGLGGLALAAALPLLIRRKG